MITCLEDIGNLRQKPGKFNLMLNNFSEVRGSNLLLFVASAYKYLKKWDYSFVIVYKLDASYKFLEQIQLKPLKLFSLFIEIV